MSDQLIVSSLIVQHRPDCAASVAAGVAAIAGAEIAAQSPEGKIVVVLESADDAALNDAISRIGEIAGVLSTSLVFHHSEQETSSP